jgi:Domain of unknown function (DUF4291)
VSNDVGPRRVLAAFDDEGVWVYQAFRPSTVAVAVAKGTFGAGFGLDRMTWIKPSLGWMLHRSNYASSKRQEAIARIKVRRSGFDEILRSGVLTSFDSAIHESQAQWSRALRATEVHVQWDPDRDLDGRPLARRAIQLGLRGSMVKRYVDEWIVSVADFTSVAKAVHHALQIQAVLPEIPLESEYPVDAETRHGLAISTGG